MTMPPRPRSCADRPPTSFLGARGSLVDAWVHACCRLVRAAWMHGCTCGAGAQRAPAAANPVWCRVERACSARAEDAVVTGLARRGVREHRRYARELLRERFAMYLFTIESVPFNRKRYALGVA